MPRQKPETTSKQLTLDAAESLLRAAINGVTRDASDLRLAQERLHEKTDRAFAISRAVMEALKSKASVVTITETDK